MYISYSNTEWSSGWGDYDAKPQIDVEKANKLEDIVTDAINYLIVFGLLLILICWRFRSLSCLIPLYDSILMSAIALIPFGFDSGVSTSTYFNARILLSFTLKFSNARLDILTYSVLSLFLRMGPLHYIGTQEFSYEIVAWAIASSVALSLAMLLIAMLATYVTIIRSRLNMLMTENLKLLNKMNEGLVLVNEQTY